MAQQRGAHSLVRVLEAHGVKYIFGLPSHGNMDILDAIYDSNQISFKLVRHEHAAAHIADGYARISGEVGVCCSSVGPGAANMIMGIATAYFTSSPILAISGGIITKQAGRGQLQETSRAETPIDQGYMQALQPFTKKVWDIQQPVRTGEIVRKAFAIAQADRPGPVAIEYPWDLQAEYVDEVEIQVPEKYAYGRGVRADKTALQKAADYLCQADCPVIVTAVEWNVPVIWLVFNDQALRAIRDGQKEAYEGRIIGTEFTQPTDFAAMARSMDAVGIRVTHVDELSGAIGQAISYNRPCVIDLQVDQEAIYPPVAGIWYEPARSPDARMPRGSSRQWT